MSRVLIIAEAGVNHNGDLKTAKELVKTAAVSGADLVKFQTFKASAVATKNAQKADYQEKTTTPSESQYEMIRKLELSRGMHEELISYCKRCEIGFFSTGFDAQSVNMLVELGQQLFKVPSGEITNLPYLRHIGKMGKPVIMSTGMSTLDEVRVAINILMEEGVAKNEITILHCNTEYPTPMEDVNLRAMLTLQDKLGVKVGYSDHTTGVEIPTAAVALGATVIEKHFTLDRNQPGPDHAASLEPDELKSMVSAIRNIERAMGDGIKKPSPSEVKNLPIARRSIVAATTIQKGESFTEDNLAVKRPGTGISPMQWDSVLGMVAEKKYSKDDLIQM